MSVDNPASDFVHNDSMHNDAMQSDVEHNDVAPAAMTVNVLFFARLREKMGQSAHSQVIDAPLTLAEFKAQLAQQLPQFADLPQPIMSAINQDFAQDHHMIYANDEVAFFPPVTGG